MALRLHNTLSRSIQEFEPSDPARVGVYGCGPTVYGHAHIGNFRTFIFYDLIHRYLEWKGYGVHFVMNLTDVDDKTIRAAREQGMTLAEYTEPFARAVLDESDALGIRRMDLYPRATAYVDRMISLVATLLERGLAYTTPDGSVFYDISAFPAYGCLSGKDLEQARKGDRVADDEYGKDDVRDFALWKAAKPGDAEVGAVWRAPWGEGRPGWHLECSAMSLAEVGETLDLHLGGEDLIFPHHEDEIAQSEGATGKPFSRFWLHVKHLRVEGSKMSKSLGNFIRVRDLLDEGVSGAAIRHQLLSVQYRRDLNFTREGLAASQRAVERLLDFADRLQAHPVEREVPSAGLAVAAKRAADDFEKALDDDLNVAGALAALFVFLNETNAILDAVPALSPEDAGAARRTVDSMDQVLGLVELGRREREVDGTVRERVEAMIAEREKARSERDWARADEIRDQLAAEGIVLEDSAGGTRWKRSAAAWAPES
jgi:cysteinyl-tRNA synthetase